VKIGSLFSGIGGLELGAERAGLGSVAWQVEIDPWCRAVLAKHWPNAVRYSDVREVGRATLAPVDVIVGGFPCQDISLAGRGAGLAGERSGLWFEYLRILGELRPRGVIVENVGGLARRGLDVVAGGLDGLGYTVEVSRVAASDIGAPHRRIRHFIVGARVADAHGEGQPQQGGALAVERGRAVNGGRVADALRLRLEIPQHVGAPDELPPAAGGRPVGQVGAVEPRVGGGADGLPSGLDGTGPGGAWPAGRGEAQHDWEPPRVAASVPDRPRRLKALGNAVVPQQGFVAALRLAELLSLHPAPVP
jgi:DNA (cytosine-5)-methyltransferase 1